MYSSKMDARCLPSDLRYLVPFSASIANMAKNKISLANSSSVRPEGCANLLFWKKLPFHGFRTFLIFFLQKCDKRYTVKYSYLAFTHEFHVSCCGKYLRDRCHSRANTHFVYSEWLIYAQQKSKAFSIVKTTFSWITSALYTHFRNPIHFHLHTRKITSSSKNAKIIILHWKSHTWGKQNSIRCSACT